MREALVFTKPEELKEKGLIQVSWLAFVLA